MAAQKRIAELEGENKRLRELVGAECECEYFDTPGHCSNTLREQLEEYCLPCKIRVALKAQ